MVSDIARNMLPNLFIHRTLPFTYFFNLLLGIMQKSRFTYLSQIRFQLSQAYQVHSLGPVSC